MRMCVRACVRGVCNMSACLTVCLSVCVTVCPSVSVRTPSINLTAPEWLLDIRTQPVNQAWVCMSSNHSDLALVNRLLVKRFINH